MDRVIYTDLDSASVIGQSTADPSYRKGVCSNGQGYCMSSQINFRPHLRGSEGTRGSDGCLLEQVLSGTSFVWHSMEQNLGLVSSHTGQCFDIPNSAESEYQNQKRNP